MLVIIHLFVLPIGLIVLKNISLTHGMPVFTLAWPENSKVPSAGLLVVLLTFVYVTLAVLTTADTLKPAFKTSCPIRTKYSRWMYVKHKPTTGSSWILDGSHGSSGAARQKILGVILIASSLDYIMQVYVVDADFDLILRPYHTCGPPIFDVWPGYNGNVFPWYYAIPTWANRVFQVWIAIL